MLPYLVLLVRAEKQNIDSVQLGDETVTFKLLANLGPEGRNWHVDAVHGLDLRSLYLISRGSSLSSYYFPPSPSVQMAIGVPL